MVGQSSLLTAPQLESNGETGPTSDEADQAADKDGPTADIYTNYGVGIFPLKTVLLEMDRLAIQVNTLIQIEQEAGNDSCYHGHKEVVHKHIHHKISKIVGMKLKEMGMQVTFKSLVSEQAKMSLAQLSEVEFTDGWASDEAEMRVGSKSGYEDITTTDTPAEEVNARTEVAVDKPDLNENGNFISQFDYDQRWYKNIDYEDYDSEEDDDGADESVTEVDCCYNCECDEIAFDQWNEWVECASSVMVSNTAMNLEGGELTSVTNDDQISWLVLASNISLIVSAQTDEPLKTNLFVQDGKMKVQSASCISGLKIQHVDCKTCIEKAVMTRFQNTREKRSMFTKLIGAVDETNFQKMIKQLQQQEEQHETQILENEQSIIEAGKREAVLNRKKMNDLVASLENKICRDVSQMKANRLERLLEQHATEVTNEITNQLAVCSGGRIPNIIINRFRTFCKQSYPGMCGDDQNDFYQAFLSTVKCKPLGVIVSDNQVVVSFETTLPDGPKTPYKGFLVLSLPVFGKNGTTTAMDIQPDTILIQTKNGARTAISRCSTIGLTSHDYYCDVKYMEPKVTNCIDALLDGSKVDRKICLNKIPSSNSMCFARNTPYGIFVSTTRQKGLTVLKKENLDLNGFKSSDGTKDVIKGVKHIEDKTGPYIRCNSIVYKAKKRKIQIELKQIRHFHDEDELESSNDDDDISIGPYGDGKGYQSWYEKNTIDTVMDKTAFTVGEKELKVHHVIKIVMTLVIILILAAALCILRYVSIPCQFLNWIRKMCPCQRRQSTNTVRFQNQGNIVHIDE